LLDIQILSDCLLLFLIALDASLVRAAWTQTILPEARQWAVAAGLIAVAAFMMKLRGVLPYGLVTAVTCIGLSLGYALISTSMARLTKREPRRNLIVFCLAFWWVATLVYEWIVPNHLIRLACISLPYVILELEIAVSCWHARSGSSGLPFRLLGIGLVVDAVGSTAAVPSLLHDGQTQIGNPEPPLSPDLLIGFLVQSILISVFFIWALSLRLRQDVTEQETARREEAEAEALRLNELVARDDLTDAFSRRHITDQLDRQVRLKSRSDVEASVLSFDLDHFKVINDRYGHATGDRALCSVVKTAASTHRPTDMLARVGGEEFLVLLPMTSGDEAMLLAERLRQAIADIEIESDAEPLRMTVSIGVAELGRHETVASWLKRADQALYLAKSQGRNRVEMAKPYVRAAAG
jgi:diguanylate cyclase (GGDEF)-like protein